MSNDTGTRNSQTKIEPSVFRNVLGNFPTGVVAITAQGLDGSPAGMAVNSFTSVSLDPPLVAFLPTKSSSSFPKIRTAGRFAVNVLDARDEQVCRNFATKGGDKFAGTNWSPSPKTGSPLLERAVAWIDCEIEQIHDAGDHYIVIGRVLDLDMGTGDGPLLFFRGGYGQFSQNSRTAPAQADLLGPLRQVDPIRTLMEGLARDLEVECFANYVIQDQLVIVGSAGQTHPSIKLSRIGQRMPLVAPLGAGAVAWMSEAEQASWIERSVLMESEPGREALLNALARVRERGWSIALASAELIALESAVGHQPCEVLEGHQVDERAAELAAAVPAETHDPLHLDSKFPLHVRNVSVPVLGPDGKLILLLSLYGLPTSLTLAELSPYLEALSQAATEAGRELSSA